MNNQRATELQELAAEEGITLPLSVDLILWLEDRGWVVCLETGRATLPSIYAPTPIAKAVSHLLSDAEIEAEADDYEDYLDDVDWLRFGC